jgi:small subunit ribosomal protein S4
VCRLCRREATKLYLKGERCHTEKCAIEKRNFPPGQHGKDRKPKIMGYGLQLREKQKVRRIYGVGERQFRNLFEKSARQSGITGENMLTNLERRLDSVVYRMGFGTSRSQARQVVRHGHVQVNGRKVNIPSYIVSNNDVVEIREKSRKNAGILAARDATAHQPTPNWLEVDREALRGRVIALPKRDELVQIQIAEQQIVELYSK